MEGMVERSLEDRKDAIGTGLSASLAVLVVADCTVLLIVARLGAQSRCGLDETAMPVANPFGGQLRTLLAAKRRMDVGVSAPTSVDDVSSFGFFAFKVGVDGFPHSVRPARLQARTGPACQSRCICSALECLKRTLRTKLVCKSSKEIVEVAD
jgi:hypothetical protein